jgi:hypothetical protein
LQEFLLSWQRQDVVSFSLLRAGWLAAEGVEEVDRSSLVVVLVFIVVFAVALFVLIVFVFVIIIVVFARWGHGRWGLVHYVCDNRSIHQFCDELNALC